MYEKQNLRIHMALFVEQGIKLLLLRKKIYVSVIFNANMLMLWDPGTEDVLFSSDKQGNGYGLGNVFMLSEGFIL